VIDRARWKLIRREIIIEDSGVSVNRVLFIFFSGLLLSLVVTSVDFLSALGSVGELTDSVETIGHLHGDDESLS